MKCKRYVKINQIRYPSEKLGRYKIYRFEPLLETLDDLSYLQNGEIFSYQITSAQNQEMTFIFITKNKEIMNFIINQLNILYCDKYNMNFKCRKSEVV